LGLEHVDARLLVTQVGLEPDEDEGCVWAEMQDFGVPLEDISMDQEDGGVREDR
jgi:hypothetical protein